MTICNVIYNSFGIFNAETAMGHKRVENNDEGFKYAMAVMK